LQYNGIEDLSFLSTMTVDLLDLSGNPLSGNAWTILTFVPGLTELVLNSAGIMFIPPTAYSTSLIVLNLAYNNITHFTGGNFQGFPNLRSLILKGNRIASLPRDLTKYTSRLTVLDISENNIEVLNPAAIIALHLIVFDASNNQIKSLSQSLKDFFGIIRNLNMQGNPFHCNCNMRWLSEWIRNLPFDRRHVEFGRCETPRESAAKIIRAMKPTEFLCKSPLVLFLASGGGKIGDTVTVECKAKGDPAPTVYLYKGPVLLEIADSSSDKMQEEVTLSYHIESFNCTDIGNYSCLGTSVAGMDEELLELGSEFIGICGNGSLTTTGVPIISLTTTNSPDHTESTTEGSRPTHNDTSTSPPITIDHSIPLTTQYEYTTPYEDITRDNTTPTYNVTRVPEITMVSTTDSIVTLSPGAGTIDNGQSLPNTTNAFIIPVVVFLAILIVFVVCITIVLCNKRTSQRYCLRARKQQRQNVSTLNAPTITYANWAFADGSIKDIRATEISDTHEDYDDAKLSRNGQALPSAELTAAVEVHSSDITCVSNGDLSISLESRDGATHDDVVT
jgi:hypothetical protein